MGYEPRLSEEQWLTGTSLSPMLDYLTLNQIDWAWGRGRYLFACGCVRRVWDLRPDERCKQAVVVTVLFADDGASPEELEAAAAGATLAAEEARTPCREAAALAAMSVATVKCGDVP